MDLIVSASSNLRGEIAPPGNKSHSFRALLLAGLADGVSTIRRPAVSGDWRRGVRALQLLGATVEQMGAEEWKITGVAGRPSTPTDAIDCGNSGLIFRFFTAASALSTRGPVVITGDESIQTIRPIGPLLDGLTQLGASAVSTKGDGHGPVEVRGPLRGGSATIDGPDSQYVSALLIAAAAAGVGVDLRVRNAGEKPWVGLTLHWLKRLGVCVEHENFEHYRLPRREGGCWKGFDYTVPTDWSAAIYPIVAALLTPGSEVMVTGLDPEDPQPDRLVLDVLRAMGGDIRVERDRVIARSSQLVGRRIDCNDFIDQFMLLAVVGALAAGETELVNAEIARHKECDRISEMANALRAMGATVDERADGLRIGRSPLHGVDLDSRADHRMVMTLATAGLAASGETIIRRAECVEKTFADFPAAMGRLGANVRVVKR
ncbi:MAG: 3-phosphoshikimate 1-carboxyvinyltransferase [Phycisphaerae bacterium]|nr:3-phosphoshikimate 1-carboxyvinyltransferase [Phycisphaerae bacterium]